MSARYSNALVDDPSWCGHAMVSLRTWTCADCDRPVSDATQLRLQAADPIAPGGSVWMLLSGDQDGCQDGCIRGSVDGIFTDRSRIYSILIRRYIVDADYIRDVMKRTHWYQCVANIHKFEGWEESPDTHGKLNAYYLSLERIDHL